MIRKTKYTSLEYNQRLVFGKLSIEISLAIFLAVLLSKWRGLIISSLPTAAFQPPMWLSQASAPVFHSRGYSLLRGNIDIYRKRG